MKMCEQVLKKRQRPNTIQILWIVNQEKANNSPSYRCAAIKQRKREVKLLHANIAVNTQEKMYLW